jgi:hypothetical protein
MTNAKGTSKQMLKVLAKESIQCMSSLVGGQLSSRGVAEDTFLLSTNRAPKSPSVVFFARVEQHLPLFPQCIPLVCLLAARKASEW